MTENGYHVSAPLIVFTKLFVDDHSLEYVINHAETEPQLNVSSTIDMLVNLLVEFQSIVIGEHHLKQFTCTALLNILWSISFQDRYKMKLSKNENLLEIIKGSGVNSVETADDQYVPRSMDSMAKAANGIFDNLADAFDYEDADNEDTISDGKPTLMISYCRENSAFCDKVLVELEKNESLFET